jgi:oxygen-dependent protoporphyrinogen oxidase
MPETIVIGAGISGLVAAYRMKRAGRDVLLLESSDRPGGVIRTRKVDGFLLEQGPNSVRMTDELEALASDLGIEREIVTGDPRAPRYVFRDGRLVPAPMGPASLVTTPLLSARAKLRLLAEPFVGRPPGIAEQSIEQFFSRRLGREIHDVLISAFVSGIYAGDTTKLSAEAVFPKLVEMEREHGGLARGAVAALRARRREVAAAAPEPKPRRRSMTIMSFASGLARLPERLGEALGESLALNASVEAVERVADRFGVLTAAGERFEARELVVATPARAAADLLGALAPSAAELLDAIEYSPLASVTLAYERDEVAHECTGFGFLAPRTSGLRTLGGIFPSSLFPGRAPEGWHSFTCFVGGATDPSAVELDDEELVGLVAADLGRAVGARGEPKVLSVTRWAHAIPQYTIGHTARVAAIERDAAAAGVRLLGNYLHGVSVGECVAAASRVLM